MSELSTYPGAGLGAAVPEPRLVYEARGIGKRFGAQVALHDVDLRIAAGSIVGLIGANGAGKSTLVKVLAGVLAPDRGQLRLDGRALKLASMLDAWHAGIALVSQELNLFPALSISENLSLVPGRSGASLWGRGHDEARAMLRRLGLVTDLAAPLKTLSLGDRQLVELARALLRHPRVLILDEPTSALHATEVDRLHRVLRDLRGSGVGIVYVSHYLNELLDVSDSVTVLRDSRRVLTVDGPGAGHMDAIVLAMLGKRVGASTVARADRARRAGSGLAVAGLRGPLGLRVDRFMAARGEVVGVVGLAGAGVAELFAILFGRLAPLAGTIALPSGRAFHPRTPAAVRAGVAFVPADRKRLGLSLDQSVSENVMAVRSLALGRDGLLLPGRQRDAIADARCTNMGVKFAAVHQRVGALSGGNQQKVVFARWIEADPSLLLLDDPMRGVDVGAKQDLYALIRTLADEGRVVLFYTSDPAEFAAIADRVIVFVNGRVTRELHAGKMGEHDIVQSMNAVQPARDETRQ